MVDFNRFTLANGLKVLVHEDATTPTGLNVFNVWPRRNHRRAF
jgi:predicted Zn-dependent peptidase